MKIVKRLLLAFVVLVFLVLIAAIAIPYFYKDEIIAFAKEEINKQVDAEVDFGDISLSLLRSFPDFSLGIKNVEVIGKTPFEGIPLAKIANFDCTLDFWSVVKSDRPVQLKSIELEQPDIRIEVLPSGKANYDIYASEETTETTTTEEEGTLLVQLDHYAIRKGNLIYNDKSTDVYVQANNLNHKGSGDFTAAIFDLDTETTIDALTAKSGGIPYLSKAKTTLDAIFNVDLNTSKYTLKDNDLRINALRMLAEGFVQMQGDDINMDLTFEAPNNDFKDLLSLIPGAYIEGYEDVKATGQVRLGGYVKGTYNSVAEKLPSFNIDIGVRNGSVQYPDLPLPIQAIQTTAHIHSPDSNLDKLKIDVPQFKMQLADNPFEASLLLRTPISDPDIDTKVKGILNLQDLSNAFPMEGVERMTGRIDADFVMKARLSQLDRGDYANVNMAGTMRVNDLHYAAADMPPVKINQLNMDFAPQFVAVKGFDALLGKSDIKASGRIDNILAYFSPEKTMKGNFVMRSDLFDANEWLTDTDENATSTASETEETEVFDRFDFTIDARISKLVYDVYELKNNVAVGNMTPNKLTVNTFETKIGNSDLQGKGTVEHIFDYLYENATLGGELYVTSTFFDLNQFMIPETDGDPKAIGIRSEEENLEPILIPENIAMTIHSDIDKLVYTNMELRDIKGKLDVKNQEVRIKDATANTLGGSFNIDGGYNTQNPDKPLFDMAYKLNRMDFQKAFNTFNTFQQLAPIGKFIEGTFNSTLSMQGVLGKDMMPDLSTLTADGFMQTLNAVIRNFKPLEKIGNQLNVSEFKSMNLKNTKNWFEVTNGKVITKEFPYSHKGIDMLIQGTHGLTGDMDYNIKAKIPRTMLEKGNIGAAANEGLNFLNKEASKLGLNLDVGKYINVLVNLTGSMNNPKISIKPLGADGEATSVKDIVNEVKETVVDTLTKVKDKVVNEVKEDFSAKKAELTKEMNTKIDNLMNNAKKQADAAKTKAIRLADRARNAAHREADKAVEDVKNPLQKIAAREAAKIAKNKADKIHADAIEKAAQQHAKAMQTAQGQADKIRQDYQKRIDALGQ